MAMSSMISRPITAALSCRQCQTAVVRAVLSRPTTTSLRTLPQRHKRPLPLLTRRLFSQQRSEGPIAPNETTHVTETPAETPAVVKAETQTEAEVEVQKEAAVEAEIEAEAEAEAEIEAAVEAEAEAEAQDAAESDDVPWFLEVEAPRHAQSQHAVTLPTIPEDAPALLEPMVKYVFEDMGLDDISLLDLRDLDPPAALGPNLIMLFGTARSERHLHISSGRFQRWLRRNYKVDARADGLIGPGELRTKLRRLRKKAKLMGTNTAIIPGGDNGISTGWVCVNFSFDKSKTGEAASFDDSGRFSGFGSSLTGTTIVVQCMTEARRNELDLETLWQSLLKRNLVQAKKVQGVKTPDEAEIQSILASKVQVSTTQSGMQWQALQRASQQQRRHHSTDARTQRRRHEYRPAGLPRAVDRAKAYSPVKPQRKQYPNKTPMSTVREELRVLHDAGQPVSMENVIRLVEHVFTCQPDPDAADKSGAPERLAMVDELLHMAEERGMRVWGEDLFVALVSSIARSPAYGPELERAQANFEFLMNREGYDLGAEHVARLMAAYAHLGDWDKFWDAFRSPTRFGRGRGPELYELAYRTMAATRQQKLCIDALRWVYPEMRSQKPPVALAGSLFAAFEACILVADPNVKTLYENPSIIEQVGLEDRKKRLVNREFLKIWAEVNA